MGSGTNLRHRGARQESERVPPVLSARWHGLDLPAPAIAVIRTVETEATSPDGRLWIAFGYPAAVAWHREEGNKSIAATLNGDWLNGECAGFFCRAMAWSHNPPADRASTSKPHLGLTSTWSY